MGTMPTVTADVVSARGVPTIWGTLLCALQILKKQTKELQLQTSVKTAIVDGAWQRVTCGLGPMGYRRK